MLFKKYLSKNEPNFHPKSVDGCPSEPGASKLDNAHLCMVPIIGSVKSVVKKSAFSCWPEAIKYWRHSAFISGLRRVNSRRTNPIHNRSQTSLNQPLNSCIQKTVSPKTNPIFSLAHPTPLSSPKEHSSHQSHPARRCLPCRAKALATADAAKNTTISRRTNPISNRS